MYFKLTNRIFYCVGNKTKHKLNSLISKVYMVRH